MEINKALEIITNSEDLYDGYGYLTKLGYEALAVLNSADVVEVVRCKDCKYYDTKGEICFYPIYAMCREKTDFCSRGERRETE